MPTRTANSDDASWLREGAGCGPVGTSLHHDNPPSLDLVDPDPHPISAMRTLNCRFAVNGEAQVRLISWIESLLKCDELPAVRACTANR
jgi:hypothetical protein